MGTEVSSNCNNCKNFNKPVWGTPCEECKFLPEGAGIENFYEPVSNPQVDIITNPSPLDMEETCRDCSAYLTHEANEPCKSCIRLSNFSPSMEYSGRMLDAEEVPTAELAVNVVKHTALDRQVGGNHYDFPIQPIEYIYKNELNFLQGNVVKYTTRYKRKNGRQDLEKAIHNLEMLIELEYGEESHD